MTRRGFFRQLLTMGPLVAVPGIAHAPGLRPIGLIGLDLDWLADNGVRPVPPAHSTADREQMK